MRVTINCPRCTYEWVEDEIDEPEGEAHPVTGTLGSTRVCLGALKCQDCGYHLTDSEVRYYEDAATDAAWEQL